MGMRQKGVKSVAAGMYSLLASGGRALPRKQGSQRQQMAHHIKPLFQERITHLDVHPSVSEEGSTGMVADGGRCHRLLRCATAGLTGGSGSGGRREQLGAQGDSRVHHAGASTQQTLGRLMATQPACS